MERKLKIVLVILLIVLISIISFGGIYVQKGKNIENVIPKYDLGMDLEGRRVITLEVDNSIKTVIYDKDGKVVDKEGEGTTKKEEPVNKEEYLTKENYEKSKKIIENRLKAMNVDYYNIRVDENNGKIYVELPENSNTNSVAQYMAVKGVFTIQNEDEEVLIDSTHLKKSQVGYASDEHGTTVYLTIELNKEGAEIFKDITNTYVESKDEDGKDTTKNVSLKIDDSVLLDTHFEEEVSNGIIQMSIGSESSDRATVQGYVKEASNIAMILNNDSFPITYKVSDNKYIMSDITVEMFYAPAIVTGVIVLIGLVVLIIKYKKNGLLSAISIIGYIGALLLVLRYTNVTLTIEGITAIVVSIALDYIYTWCVLKNQNASIMSHMMNVLFKFIPVAITAVILCFANWLPIYSFGMVMFWNLILMIIYNLAITRTLIASK